MSDTPQRSIVAMGGGGFSMEPDNPAMDDWLCQLPRTERPRVCFIPTASGDADDYIERFYKAFESRRCRPSHLALFRRTVDDISSHLIAQDLIYVGGGNTANMLAVWRTHGVDDALRQAWRRGVVLCGLSAGAICWFESGLTDSFGQDPLRPLHTGLGLLRGSFCPHYDGESGRRPTYRQHIVEGTLPPGYAVDDGVALRFEGEALVEVVSSSGQGCAWRVDRRDGAAHEAHLDVTSIR